MKILLVTLYGKDNIGNRLQHLALQQSVFKIQEDKKFKGDDNLKVVSYIYKMSNSYALLNIIKSVVKRVLGLAGVKKYKNIKVKNQLRYEYRAKRFRRFTYKYLYNLVNVRIDGQVKKISNFDAAIVGSDQVWHHWGFAKNELLYFYLSFMKPSKRISYAPSFGFRMIPVEDYTTHKNGLAEMRYLSCRETEMIDIIKGIVGKEPKLVLDPTLLLLKREWSDFEKKPNYRISAKYILVYFLGEKSEMFFSNLHRWSNELGAGIIDIYNVENKTYYFTSPDEFLYLIHHAEMIVTDSFHGTVFSIIYHKKFYVFKRIEKNMDDMFDRIETLLNQLNIKGQVVDQNVDSNVPLPIYIDYGMVEELLKVKRKESIEYLYDSIFNAVER